MIQNLYSSTGVSNWGAVYNDVKRGREHNHKNKKIKGQNVKLTDIKNKSNRLLQLSQKKMKKYEEFSSGSRELNHKNKKEKDKT